MKIIFLDFDGVLNSEAWWAREKQCQAEYGGVWSHYDLDERAIDRLNTIVHKTGAKVVVSSTWRKIHPLEELQAILRAVGFTGEVIDHTPGAGHLAAKSLNGATVEGHKCRGEEIQSWLDHHSEEDPVESFVILDDDSDMAHLAPKLVQTKYASGLLDFHIPLVEAMLNVPCEAASSQ